jgi:GAF domain-containing protein
MFSDRLLSIFEMMAARERSGSERGLLCAVASEITGVSAAGIALSADDLPLTRFCTSETLSRSLIDLEMTVGEGPCSESLNGDVMVHESDLTSPSSERWILFTPQALALGARAVFAIPVRIGVIRLGVLCLYNETAGELSDEQTTDALLVASVVGRGIVALQAGARPESLSHELQSEANFDFSVHQAAGMVAVQASLSISSALIALRMHAFSCAESLSSVSARVISRALRFDFGLQEWIEVAR